jgi:hypothetical protein
MKLRSMRLVGYAARVENLICRLLIVVPEGKGLVEAVDVDERKV